MNTHEKIEKQIRGHEKKIMNIEIDGLLDLTSVDVRWDIEAMMNEKVNLFRIFGIMIEHLGGPRQR